MVTMNTPHSDTSSPVDLPAALMRTMGDVEFLREMLGSLTESLPGQVTVITTALDAHAAEELAAAAHKLKGTALNLSAGRIAESARLLEQAGREGRLDTGEVALAQLKQDCADLTTFLENVDWTALTPADDN